MTIVNSTEFINSSKQFVQFTKTATAATLFGSYFSIESLAGVPTGGLAIDYGGIGLTSGLVPTDATGGLGVGYPAISNFGANTVGYLSQIEFSNTVTGRLKLYDKLFIAGSYNSAGAVNQTLTSQPSFASRIVNGSYTGLQLWCQVATNLSGVLTVNVTYTNENGTTGRVTSTAIQGNSRRMFQFPLQAGDKGVQQITNVSSVTGGGGLYNILIMRPLWSGRVRFANDLQLHTFKQTAMKQVFQDSALTLIVQTDSNATTGLVDLEMLIVSG